MSNSNSGIHLYNVKSYKLKLFLEPTTGKPVEYEGEAAAEIWNDLKHQEASYVASAVQTSYRLSPEA
ncbi:hypothetical protein [Stenomitos frigidus]|uniref:Uncharacterized protein n=1 Tax=Stenomitos frigidus ULC18 TaxID=2107698 RepID=A0A2T1DU48_9CYAN|nr:hypothetical protein [Stenomitos frigidus]PSB24010.1 hypothetical protein C7B82_28765 [Stenomitos frigidus ULC18]